ncbi:hypothetical protein THZB04_10275 [Vibrio owensii]|nr:hypothetical protein THZB04_10275 [Vibrio owensii]
MFFSGEVVTPDDSDPVDGVIQVIPKKRCDADEVNYF